MSGHTTVTIAKPIDQEGVLYQRRAFLALPLLVRQAEAGQTIHYEQLSSELGMPNPRNLNYVLGSMGTSLLHLGQLWGQEIPAIQALVTNKASGLPGRGFTEFLRDPGAVRGATSAQQRALHQRITDKIRFYQRWRDVLAHFKAQPWKGPPPEAATHGSGDHGGESPEHQAFKEAVRLHPAWFRIPECPASVEYPFVTGDTVDVYLACEHEFPAKLLGVAHVLGVEFFDRLGTGH